MKKTEVEVAAKGLLAALRRRKLMDGRRWYRVVMLAMDPEDGRGLAWEGVAVEPISRHADPGFARPLADCLMHVATTAEADELARQLLGAKSLVKFVESRAKQVGVLAAVEERAETLSRRSEKGSA